jgi:hypothetical protein
LKTNDEPETPQTVEPQNPPAPPVPPTNMTINAPPDTEIRPVM